MRCPGFAVSRLDARRPLLPASITGTGFDQSPSIACITADSTSSAMKHYDFARKFRALYEQAVARYSSGKRGAAGFFTAEEVTFLNANGLTAQHLYDYAEDRNNYGEPDVDTALAIECVRRDYFLNVQGGRALAVVLDDTTLPPKTAAVRGITWLPRLLPKARAKLRGELPASLMFGCGGDRAFFSQHDIFPAEFLSLVWRSGDNDDLIVDWVERRIAAK
jgi:hypothetical protein